MLFLFSLAGLAFVTTTIPACESLPNTEIASAQHDVLRRLDELERQDKEKQAELEKLREENIELQKVCKSNGKLTAIIDRLCDRVNNLEDRERVICNGCDQQTNCRKSSVEEGLVISEEDAQKATNSFMEILKEPTPSLQKMKGFTMSNKQGHKHTRQLDTMSTIAFFATRSSSHAEHLGQHQPIVFDRIITNVAQAYHNTTGTFIAPVSGVHVFCTTILTFTESAHFQFAVNGHPYSNMVSYSSETYETLSQTAIFSLNKGDDVSIQSVDTDKFVHGFDYSAFSGFLLAPIDGDIVVG